MLDNLPIGVYVTGTSLVHRLRARTKLLLLLWLAGLFFIANHKMFHFGVYGTAFALLLGGMLLARLDLGYIWRRMRLFVLLLALGIPITLMLTPGHTWHTFRWDIALGGVQMPLEIVVTYDGLWLVISFTAIFLLLYLGSMLVTLTTTPVALAEAVVLLLRPFRRLGLPVDEFGLMTLVSLRFIPVLVQEAEQLVKAQVSRGAEFTTGSPAARLRGAATLLVPLVQGALRRAEGLSAAIEARGLAVGAGATPLHEGPLRPLDYAALVLLPAITALAYWRL